MSLWERLFGARSRPVQPTSRAALPKAPTSLPMPPAPRVDPRAERQALLNRLAAWAKDLKDKKDYDALVEAIDNSNDPDWSDKKDASGRALREAGSEAADAILRKISAKGYCSIYFADALVAIGDGRAAPVLQGQLAKGQFDAYGSKHHIQAFVSKHVAGFEEEAKAAEVAAKAAADARLSAGSGDLPLREYSTAYIFRPESKARNAFRTLQAALTGSSPFPSNAPHQVALVHGPASDFVAVLVRLPTAKDEGVALHDRLVRWFNELGVADFEDYETLSAPLPGRLSRGLNHLAGSYSTLEIVDRL
jgi:hypothetical protein